MNWRWVNPVAVFGRWLGADYSASVLIVQRFMDDAIPGAPKCILAVDVRDVADLHIRSVNRRNRSRFAADWSRANVQVSHVAHIHHQYIGAPGIASSMNSARSVPRAE